MKMKIIFNQKDAGCTKIQYTFIAWVLRSVKCRITTFERQIRNHLAFIFLASASLAFSFSFVGQYQDQDTEGGHGTFKHPDQDWDLPISWSWQETLPSGSVTKQSGKDGLEIVQWPPASNRGTDPKLLLAQHILWAHDKSYTLASLLQDSTSSLLFHYQLIPSL